MARSTSQRLAPDSTFKTRRFSSRPRIVRNLIIGICVLGCTALFWQLFSQRHDIVSHLSIATAYPALLLTTIALLLGPWNVLRRHPNPISFNLRRDIGIWAGLTALLHTIVGLNVHLRGRPWLYFLDENSRLRHDLFGFGNYTGLISALVFLLLLAISNDLMLRRLGSRKWKSVQRWTYAAAVLTVGHAVAYQLIEKRQILYQVLLWGATATVAAAQFAGWRTIKTVTSRSLVFAQRAPK